MKVIIVKKNTKTGERYYAYYQGLLSWLGIYCPLNMIMLSGADTKEQCIDNAKTEIAPSPKPNTKVVCKVEI
jgi:hypothetical protein